MLKPQRPFHVLSNPVNPQTWIFIALQSKIHQELLSSWLGSYQAAVGITRGQLKCKRNHNQGLHQNSSMQLAPRAGALLKSGVLQGGLQFSSQKLQGCKEPLPGCGYFLGMMSLYARAVATLLRLSRGKVGSVQRWWQKVCCVLSPPWEGTLRAPWGQVSPHGK